MSDAIVKALSASSPKGCLVDDQDAGTSDAGVTCSAINLQEPNRKRRRLFRKQRPPLSYQVDAAREVCGAVAFVPIPIESEEPAVILSPSAEAVVDEQLQHQTILEGCRTLATEESSCPSNCHPSLRDETDKENVEEREATSEKEQSTPSHSYTGAQALLEDGVAEKDESENLFPDKEEASVKEVAEMIENKVVENGAAQTLHPMDAENEVSSEVDSGLKCLTNMLDAITRFSDVAFMGSSQEQVESALSAALCNVERFADWRWPATVNHAMSADVDKLLLSGSMAFSSAGLAMKYGLSSKNKSDATTISASNPVLSEICRLSEPLTAHLHSAQMDLQDEDSSAGAASNDMLPRDGENEHDNQLPQKLEQKVYAFGEECIEEDLSAWIERRSMQKS